MIFIKTNMGKMPFVCKQCTFYATGTYWPSKIIPQSCRACCEKGKEYKSLIGIRVTKERPDWCPLVEAD